MNATLTWDYNLQGRTLRVVSWSIKGNNIGEIRPPSNPEVFLIFKPRFNLKEEATLIIVNVTRSDEGEYSCVVQNDQTLESVPSKIQLHVLCKYKIDFCCAHIKISFHFT